MEYRRITIDVGTLLRDERPKIGAYLEKKMELVPPAGVTREMFRAIARELCEMMFAAGVGRMMEAMQQSVPAAEIDAATREKEVCA
jgi:hypothetical protein|nr:MAG TPA: hypothetical protein [Caudoviricetes sp.]